MVILVLATAIPIPVLAQDGVILQGRVFVSGGTAAVVNARVELEGHGATLSSVSGMFRFERVEPGIYTLQVYAFGYASETRSLTIHSDTSTRGEDRISWGSVPRTRRRDKCGDN